MESHRPASPTLLCDACIEFVHRLQERIFQVNVIGRRENHDAPETVGEFVSKPGIRVRDMANTITAENKLGKIAYIADETERDLFIGPRSPVVLVFERRIFLSHRDGALE
jgi:hypothetical protein